jgi:F420-dependent oxidoreductase-like protein
LMLHCVRYGPTGGGAATTIGSKEAEQAGPCPAAPARLPIRKGPAVKLGLHISDFTWPDGAPRLGSVLADVASKADDAGFERISVMDHLWQIGVIGPPEHEMLEAYTTLGYLAARTSEVELVSWVTAVVYREPGMLAKLVSTLDVLSGGRAWLGIGAAWNEEEARGLGLPFPPTAERFERLEETLQICLQMWSEDDGPYEGRHYQLARTLNSPQSLRRPHPPILIGGSGEKKTLRLVAKYAQACNLFGTPEVEHKLEVLRGHCEREGRNYNDIEKTVMTSLDPGENGENVDAILQQLQHYARLGISAAHGIVPGVWKLSPLKILGKEVVPTIADW